MRVSRLPESPSQHRKRTGSIVLIGLGSMMLVLAACQSRPLPEAESAPARLYVERCSRCHVPYNPRSMTRAMWATQVDLMQGKMRDASIKPLTADEQRIIVDYLTRNAGTQ